MSSIRVAVASTNGVDIDQSLRETSCFHIYDVEPDGFGFIELREDVGLSASTGDESAQGRLGRILENIADCSLLLVRDVGVCWGKLQIDGVTVYEAPMPIRKALAKRRESALFRRELAWPVHPQAATETSLGRAASIISISGRS